MNPILNHWYEFADGVVQIYDGKPWGSQVPILRDLTIGPENLITAEDVGRWAMVADGACVSIRAFERKIARFSWGKHPDVGCRDNGTIPGFNTRLTRFLSARECAERKLAATHPTQIASARAPGEFRVGDRVRLARVLSACAVEVGVTGVVISADHFRDHWGESVRLSHVPVLWDRPQLIFQRPAEELELIEPAREGEGAASSTAALNRGSDPATLPPAPPASDFERLRDFFTDKRPAAVPFALGQRVEAVVRRESCPTCHHGRIFFPETRQVITCPECAGRGWQEVR